MNSEPRISEPAGGDGLMLYIAASVIVVVGAEIAFIALASWWLLVLVLVGVVAATAGVVTALLRTIDHDVPLYLPAARPPAEPRTTPAPRSAPAPRGAALAGH